MTQENQTQESPPEVTEAQKEAVQKFVSHKIDSDFYWYDATVWRPVNSMSFQIVAGKTFEPHLKEGVVYVGSLWNGFNVKPNKKGKK